MVWGLISEASQHRRHELFYDPNSPSWPSHEGIKRPSRGHLILPKMIAGTVSSSGQCHITNHSWSKYSAETNSLMSKANSSFTNLRMNFIAYAT